MIVISAMEPEIKKLSDEELKAKTAEFKARIAARLEGITDAEEIKTAERKYWTRFCRGFRGGARSRLARCRCGTSMCS